MILYCVNTQLTTLNTNLNDKQSDWELISTITHNANSHSESIDFSQYKEIKVVGKCTDTTPNMCFISEVPVDILGSNALAIGLGGGMASVSPAYGSSSFVLMTTTAISFTANSLMLDLSVKKGIFYVYAR